MDMEGDITYHLMARVLIIHHLLKDSMGGMDTEGTLHNPTSQWRIAVVGVRRKLRGLHRTSGPTGSVLSAGMTTLQDGWNATSAKLHEQQMRIQHKQLPELGQTRKRIHQTGDVVRAVTIISLGGPCAIGVKHQSVWLTAPGLHLEQWCLWAHKCRYRQGQQGDNRGVECTVVRHGVKGHIDRTSTVGR